MSVTVHSAAAGLRFDRIAIACVPAPANRGRPYGQRARRVRSPFWLMCRKTGGWSLGSRYGWAVVDCGLHGSMVVVSKFPRKRGGKSGSFRIRCASKELFL